MVHILQILALGYIVSCYLRYGSISLGIGHGLIAISISFIVEPLQMIIYQLKTLIGIFGNRKTDA